MDLMASDSVLAQALADLAGLRHTRVDAGDKVPKLAGLYAFYGDEQLGQNSISLLPSTINPCTSARPRRV